MNVGGSQFVVDAAPPTVEFRIPLSATRGFMRMLHYFLESLQVFGGDLGRRAHTVVSVSRDMPPRDLFDEHPWLEDYSVAIEWLEQDLFDRYEYDATGFHRFGLRSNADVVVLADADILVLGDFDEAVWKAVNSQKILGVVAPASPFNLPGGWHRSSRFWWNRVFREAGLGAPDLRHRHTGWGQLALNPIQRRCPDYFNYGFVLGPRDLVDAVGTTFEDDLAVVERVANSVFKSQVTNTIAFTKHHLPCAPLPMEYNFTFNRRAIEGGPLGWRSRDVCQPDQVKILHYLGVRPVALRRDCFDSQQKIEAALATAPVNAYESLFLAKLRQLHARISRNVGRSGGDE